MHTDAIASPRASRLIAARAGAGGEHDAGERVTAKRRAHALTIAVTARRRRAAARSTL
jgi:hypothetical protein